MSALRFLVVPALGAWAIAACVGDAAPLAPPSALNDSGTNDAFAAVDASKPSPITDCGAAPAAGLCASSWQDRSFARSDLGAAPKIYNVAIGSFGDDIYAAMQATAAGIEGQTSYAIWGSARTPDGSAFAAQTLCKGRASCLGPLHITSGVDVRAVYPADQCEDGLMVSALSTPAGLELLNCMMRHGGMTDAVAAGIAPRRVAQAYAGSRYGDGFTSDSVTEAPIAMNLDGAAGLWGGVFKTGDVYEFAVVGTRNGNLVRTAARSNLNAPYTDTFGTALRFPDIAVFDSTSFVAGIDQGGEFVLQARKWGSGVLLQEDSTDLKDFGLFQPPVTSRAGLAESANLRPHHPIEVRAGSDGLQRLVVLSAIAPFSDKCNLHAFVETNRAAHEWRKYTLRSNQPCNDISFDATLDARGALHVLHADNVAGHNIGYSLLQAP